MRHPLKILLAGRYGESFSQVERLLAEHRQMQVTLSPITPDSAPSLSAPQDNHDAIVLVVDQDWREVFKLCFKDENPALKPLLVVGPSGDMELLRLTMRLGGRDFFPAPPGDKDLIATLDRLGKEAHERHGSLSSRVTTFINAKGGSGASFCAANYAHILAGKRNRRTILLDFELQFGSLSTYFNLQSRNGLIRALELVETLDVSALPGYTQQHPSGLYLLAAATEGLVLPEDIHEDRVAKLFRVLDEAFEELVVDMPRRIDRASAAVLDRSDLIMVVVQQTVAHLQEAKRLTGLLTGELGLLADRLILIVNRYDRRGEVTLRDFQEAMPGLRIETLPNDYRNVSQSINLGIPLLEHQPRAPLGKAIAALVDTLSAKPEQQVRKPKPDSWLTRLTS
jgi:pilus assembly protein CpaE